MNYLPNSRFFLWFKPPVFEDNEKNRLGQQLYYVLMIGIVALFIEALVNLFFDTDPFSRDLISLANIFLCLLLVLTALLLLQKGRIGLGAGLLLVPAQAIIFFNGMTYRGLRGVEIHVTYLILLLVSVFVGGTAVTWIGLFSAAGLVALYLGENAGWIVTGFPPLDLDDLLIVLLAVTLTTIFLRITVTHIVTNSRKIQQQKLALEKSESRLRTYQTHLEDLVAQRTSELESTNVELREAKFRAEEASRSKSLFLANMSHELRTPLNAIIGYSEVILEDLEDDMPVNLQDLERIRYSGQHLLSLISNVLDLSKIEANKMEVHWQPLRLENLLVEIGEIIYPMMRRQENIFEVENLAGDLVLVTDPQKVRQILLNLLSNGAKFTESGRVWLKIKCDYTNESPRILFQVADTGVGIEQEKIAQLFMPFEQAENSFSRMYEGTGLGLAIANHFCQLLGGSISVTSEKGVGSTFQVSLPIQPETLTSLPAASPPPVSA